MSKVINILVEGRTETDFVKEVLVDYFRSFGIDDVRPIGMETSTGYKGGDVSFGRYSDNVRRLLSGKEQMIVTSLIDYYKLRKDFPGYAQKENFAHAVQRVEHIEKQCYEIFSDPRLIPYIQLHEFEGLLFSDAKGFEAVETIPTKNKKELISMIAENENPELINEGPTSAPSKRLERLIPNYSKPLFGNYIALEIGIETILQKCPRFKNWIDILIAKATAA